MDDFFDDIPAQETEGEAKKNTFNADIPPVNRKKRVHNTILAIVLAVVCFILGGFTVWFSLDAEMRTLIKVKNAIDDHYYQDVDDDEFYDAVFYGINHILLDKYSQYMTADEFRSSKEELAGNRIGIGIVFTTQTADQKPQMLVTRVCGNSPAEKAGVLEGDYLIAFGKQETEMTESVVFDEFSKFLNTLNEGEDFYVRVQSGSETKTLTMSREAYVENYVFYRTKTTAYGFTGAHANILTEKGAPLACLDEETAYVRLVQFGEGTENQFEQVMALFKKEDKKNLVLDLRGNGGGYLDTMQEIAGYFGKNSTERKPIAVVADYGKKKESFKAARNVYSEYFSENSQIYVLADSGTASASECLIGYMVDYGAIGFEDICLIERGGVASTYGKGIMQTTYYLSARKDAIKLTTAEIRWPISGRSIHGRGVLPEDGTKTAKENIYGDVEIADAWTVLKN